MPGMVVELGLKLGEATRQQEFVGEILRLLADNFKAETTLNQLRIGHFISLRSEYHYWATSNSEISREL